MYCVKDNELTAVDMLEMLHNVDLVPGGSVFVYYYTLADAHSDWVADDCWWIINETVELPRRSPHACIYVLLMARLSPLPSDVKNMERTCLHSHNTTIPCMKTIRLLIPEFSLLGSICITRFLPVTRICYFY